MYGLKKFLWKAACAHMTTGFAVCTPWSRQKKRVMNGWFFDIQSDAFSQAELCERWCSVILSLWWILKFI